VKVNVVNVSMDSNAAISAINVMIGQKVDGIAIVVPDQQIGPQVIDMAAQAKIPLVSADDPIKSGTGEAAAFVGFDGFDLPPAITPELFTRALGEMTQVYQPSADGRKTIRDLRR